MRSTTLLSVILLATLGLVGCSSATDGVLDDNGMPPRPPKAPTLEQVKHDMPFTVVLPKQLPHDIRFWYPLEGINPNTGKPDTVTLVFLSPDKKYAFNVEERAIKQGMGRAPEGSKKVEINGKESFISKPAKGAFIMWNDGKVVYSLDTSANTDISSDQGLIDIATSFK
jgi:hypothetical protein